MIELKNINGETRTQVKSALESAMRTAIRHGIEDCLKEKGEYKSKSWSSKVEREVLNEMVQKGEIENCGNGVYKSVK